MYYHEYSLISLLPLLFATSLSLSPSPWIDFIKVLRAAFMHTDPKSTKKTDGLTIFFALLGSAHIKAVHKMLVKLIPPSLSLSLSLSLSSKSEKEDFD